MEDGSGVAKLYPQLTQEHLATLLDELPCLIREGIDRPESLIKMPPNPSLQPVDITNIINYICNDLFEINEEFTMTQIEQALIQCPQE